MLLISGIVGKLTFLGSVVLAIAITLLIATAMNSLAGGRFFLLSQTRRETEDGQRTLYEFGRPFEEVTLGGWGTAAVIGLLVGFINFITPKLSGWTAWFALLFFAGMLFLSVILIAWWNKQHDDGGGAKKMGILWFSIIAVLFYVVTMVCAYRLTETIIKDTFLKSLIIVIPKIMLAMCIGFFIIKALFFYYGDNDVDSEKAKVAHIVARIFIVVKTIIVIVLLVTGVKWSLLAKAFIAEANDEAVEANDKATEAPVDLADEQTEEPQYSWYGFYNLSLLQDEDPSNDYNFGPNPYVEGKDVSYYVDDFKTRISEDPALGSGNMAYHDRIVGTRYMGLFYDECNEKWDVAINYAKEKFMEDQKLYYDTITAFFEFLDSAVEVKVQWGKGIEDQMYQNPYTVNGIPDVITLKTDEHEGWFLVFYYEIKGNRIAVPYRINCGYQPCNVERVMDIKPLPEKPVPSVAPNTPTPKPQDPAPKSNTPTPKPQAPTNTPTPKNLKDPTKGTKVGPNDDPGPGPDTNNGVGAQHSKDEKPTNSTFKNYDEYKESQKQLKDINKDQKQGGDANVPAVTSKPGTKVDSNADNGTGNGGIDKKTPTQGAIHVVAPDGTTHENSSGNGTAWGGPVD